MNNNANAAHLINVLKQISHSTDVVHVETLRAKADLGKDYFFAFWAVAKRNLAHKHLTTTGESVVLLNVEALRAA